MADIDSLEGLTKEQLESKLAAAREKVKQAKAQIESLEESKADPEEIAAVEAVVNNTNGLVMKISFALRQMAAQM